MLGDKIREIRKNKNMTLNDLAASIGVTASYISQLERNIIDPSISSLRRIAAALEVPIYTFMEEEADKQHIVVKSNERHKLELPNSSIIYEYISPTATTASISPKMEVIYFQLMPEGWSSDENLVHKAEECMFVMKGSVTLYLGEDTYILDEGDSVYIRENVPHRMYNSGSVKAIGISCLSPANY